MKKLFVLLLATTSVTVAMAGADYDKPVRFEELPAAARELIQTHFSGAKVTLSTVDREFMDTTYDVIFTDGTQIEFDSRGQWKEIDCRESFVPNGVMLPGIVETIGKNYPNARVRDIERDRQGFEVNLDNRTELYFDSKGNFMGYDD
jgi:hypothetical protein